VSTIKRVSTARRAVNRYRRLRGDLLDRRVPAPPVASGENAELRLLLVCYGNSCRSPMAEGILRARLADEGLLGRVVVDSAGTNAGDPGAPPNWRAREVARRHGLAIGGLRSRRLVREDLDRFDRIYAFDRENLEAILSLARTKEQAENVSLLGIDDEIADPIRGGDDEYEACFAAIERAAAPLLEDVRARLARVR
jgi:protein-tyrosine phosphatase